MGSRFLPPSYRPTGVRAFDSLLFEADQASEEGNQNAVLDAIVAIWGWLDGHPDAPGARLHPQCDATPGKRRVRGLAQAAVAAARHDLQGHHASAAANISFAVAMPQPEDNGSRCAHDTASHPLAAANETVRSPWAIFVETVDISNALAKRANAAMADIGALMQQASAHLVLARCTMAKMHAVQDAPG